MSWWTDRPGRRRSRRLPTLRMVAALGVLAGTSGTAVCSRAPAGSPAALGGDLEGDLDGKGLKVRRLATGVVAPGEGILGRVVREHDVLLLTSRPRLVAIDRAQGGVRSIPVAGLDDSDALTGLGALPDGSLWTLSGWSTLLQIAEGGEVVARQEMRGSYTGLHSGFDSLLFQPLSFDAGTPALVTVTAGGEVDLPWGTLQVRDGAEPGPIRLGWSLAKCSAAVQARMACWLAGATDIEMRDAGAGATRLLLRALAPLVVTDVMTFADTPHRVIRDLWLDTPDIWVLARASSGEQPDRRGPYGLWRFDAAGMVTATHRLASRARLIVGIRKEDNAAELWLLTADGDLVAVRT